MYGAMGFWEVLGELYEVLTHERHCNSEGIV